MLLSKRNKVVIRPHRLTYEWRRGLRPPLQPSRRLRRLAPRRSRRPETHSLLHLWPSHLRLLRAGKFGRGSKHQPKPPSTSPGQAASTVLSYSSPPTASGPSITPAPAPPLAPESSVGSGGRSRPVLGLVSRRFEEALSGAGVTKDGSRLERAAEKEKEKRKEKEKEREPLKDGPSGSTREGRREDDDARPQGRHAAAPQPGVFSAPTTLQRGGKQVLPRTL